MQASTARTYVLGVLGIPPGDENHLREHLWFVADFYALKCTFGDIPYEQKWLCRFDLSHNLHALSANPASKSNNTILHGPRESKRFTLQSMERFYTVYRNKFKLRILSEIVRIADEARSGDHIILAFFGHGQQADDIALKGGIQVGSADAWLYAHELRDAVQDVRARLTLITTSCFADWQWRHGPWDLVAASQKGESLSLPTSISDRCWGSHLIASLPEIAANGFDSTFRPEYSQSMTHKLTSSEQPYPRPTPRLGGCLQVTELEKTITKLAACMQHTSSEEVIDQLRPSIVTNTQWTCWSHLIGVSDSHTILQHCHALKRVDGTVRAAVPPCLGVQCPRVSEKDDSVCESSDDKRIKEAGPLDLARLERLTARWRETTAGTLRTHTHAVVATLLDSYNRGQISDERMKILFTTLVWREKMELLAEKILINSEDTRGWFTGTCLNYKDLQGYIDVSGLHHDVEFGTVLWGKLEELDLKVLGAGGRVHRKPCRWLWAQWKKSGTGVEGLKILLLRLGGGIYDPVTRRRLM